MFPAENTVITINGNIDDREFINYFSNLLKNSNKAKIKLVNKKPIMASEEEQKENSRSTSAKLRIVERI